MAINYEFNIANIICYAEYDSRPNAAFDVWWDYVGKDGEHSSNVTGNTLVPYEQSENFVPYRELSKAQFISLIEQYTDPKVITDAKTLIETKIEEAKGSL